MAPQEGPSDSEIQKLKREKQQAEEAARKAKLATTAATFIPGAQEFAPFAGAAAKSAESRAQSVEAQLKHAQEERRAAEQRAQQPQYAAASPAPVAVPSGPGIVKKLMHGIENAAGSVLPEGTGQHILRGILILGAAFTFYVLLKRLGIKTPFNLSFIIIFGLAAAVYEIAPGPISKLFRWASLLGGGIVGFWALAMGPFDPSITKWAILTWLVLYTVMFFSVLGFRKGMIVLVTNVVVFGLLFTQFYNGVIDEDTPLGIALQGQQNAWSEIYRDVKELSEQTAKGIRQQYYIATGDYEQGIEENSGKPLGVYLKDVGMTSETVSPDDTVNVFATLKSQSFKFDKELKINVACYESDKQEMPDKRGEITPKKEFAVAEDEEQPVDCNINAVHLGPGRHDITLEATFGFSTSAYAKGYFMLQDQIRSYKRQHPEDGTSPLDEFGITDKNPGAVFTGGPLYVGMGVGLQPIPLPEENYGPTLTITLDKNWPEGELMAVKSLTITVPPGLKITKVSGRNVADGNYCKVNDLREDTCVLDKPEILDRLFPPIEKPVRLRKNIRVETMIADKATLMANAPLAIRSFKFAIDYDYRIKKTATVTVQAPKSPEKAGGIA
jgi:hypothetical protein